MIHETRVPFRSGFPDIVIQQPTDMSTRPFAHPDYGAAKAGDIRAATRFAAAMVNRDGLSRIKAMIGDTRPTIVPVHAEEAAGRNAIPALYAAVLGHELGLPIDTSIVQANRPHRTGGPPLRRITSPVDFYGDVVLAGDYLIADDHMTQGGTLAALRSYIEHRGGNVVRRHDIDRCSR